MTKVSHPAQFLFSEKHPLTAEFNMQFIPEDEDNLRIELIAPESFADADGKTVHTGFNTLLLDTALGSCAIGRLAKMQPIATIRLNCNHLHKLEIGEPVYCRATWNGEENEISYISGELRRSKDDAVISTAIGSFMIGTAGRPLSEKKAGA